MRLADITVDGEVSYGETIYGEEYASNSKIVSFT
jgi:hypothetical protein